jgi:predicted MPP superfamily phosphohydrolase
VICTFGNHDYSIYGKNHSVEGKRRADYLEKCLRKRGLIVLRNERLVVRSKTKSVPTSFINEGGNGKVIGDETSLVIVGLDDEWSGHIDPNLAFAGLGQRQPIICLNHNPSNCNELMTYPWQWMLSGHTHGRQVATSPLGRRFYPHRYRHFTHGYYSVNGRHLYVNRGLSYGQRVLEWCRPEITVFKLEAHTSDT